MTLPHSEHGREAEIQEDVSLAFGSTNEGGTIIRPNDSGRIELICGKDEHINKVSIT